MDGEVETSTPTVWIPMANPAGSSVVRKTPGARPIMTTKRA